MSGLRNSLQSVYDRRGELTAKAVVAEWRDKAHPDHDRLTWDDAVAGERYREVEAQRLIRSVTITYREAKGNRPERSTRYWQSVRGESGQSYMPAHEIAADPVLTEIVRADMRREFQQMKDRYGHFDEFLELCRAASTEEAA